MSTFLSATTNLANTSSFTQPIRPDTYVNTILAVHPNVSRRKKEAYQAELITQYEISEVYKELFKEKIVLVCDKAYLVTIKINYLGFRKNCHPNTRLS